VKSPDQQLRPWEHNGHEQLSTFLAQGRLSGVSVWSSSATIQRLQISSYDPRWVLEFEAERDRVAQALGKLACRIDHNGSTAVPGLETKPIIDIQVSVEQLQPLRAYSEPLCALGYVHVSHVDDTVCPFFHRPKEWPHTHHVHIVQSGEYEERRTLAFRDFLREHSDVAREYVALKRQLATQVNAVDCSSRETYAKTKSEFIDRMVQIALEAGYPRGL
jgi:GrpB-like predicted nucleotidyltransferase (UPF0157 family)